MSSMKIFDIASQKSEMIEELGFLNEKEIQTLVERNTQKFFGLEFLGSEVTVQVKTSQSEAKANTRRFDTLCFDKANRSFVIIEYKEGKAQSLADQCYTYRQLAKDSKAELVLKLRDHWKSHVGMDTIAWQRTKVMVVADSFTDYQKEWAYSSEEHFEFYQITKFANNTVSLKPLHSISGKETERKPPHETPKRAEEPLKATEPLSPSPNQERTQPGKEEGSLREQYYTSMLDEGLAGKWTELRKKCLEIPGTTFNAKSKGYLKLTSQEKRIAAFYFHKSRPSINIYRGQKKADGSVSKGFFTLEDPRGISTDWSGGYSDERRIGVTRYAHEIPWNKETDVDYLVGLIKQKFDKITTLQPQNPGLPRTAPIESLPVSRAEELPQPGKGEDGVQERQHISKLHESLVAKWAELRKGCLEIPGTTFDASSKDYLRLMIERKRIAAFHFHKSKPYIDIYRGQKHPDGSVSKDFLKIDDPRRITTERWWEYSGELRAGVRGYAYKIPWNRDSDVSYLVSLIRQKFNQMTSSLPKDPRFQGTKPIEEGSHSRVEGLAQPSAIGGKIAQIEKDHTSVLDKSLAGKWRELRERCLEIPGAAFDSSGKRNLGLKFQKKVIATFDFHKSGASIYIYQGQLNPDKSVSKGFFELYDPKGISTETSWEYFVGAQAGKKGFRYKIPWVEDSDVDYVVSLIWQKYRTLVEKK